MHSMLIRCIEKHCVFAEVFPHNTEMFRPVCSVLLTVDVALSLQSNNESYAHMQSLVLYHWKDT